MEIENITIGEAREIARLLGNKPADEHRFKVGGNYFIRTVTHHQTGELVAVTQNELWLKNAAWIADDGRLEDARLEDALKTGDFSEVEMFPRDGEVFVGRGAIIDGCQIQTLPTSQK